MKGFVPTPPAVVDLMTRKLFGSIRPGASQRLLDPGCGTGEFLDGVLRWCKRRGAAPLHCTGVELNPSLATVLRRRFGGNDAVTIIHADFLRRAFEPFDFIIGNPPYVSICHLTESQKTTLRRRFETARGRFDLYILFMERALKNLSPDGRLVFITPEKFTYVATAAPLRRLLSKMQVEELHLLDEATFGDLITYPAITTIRNRRSGVATRVVLRDGTRRSIALPTDGSSWLPAINGRAAPTPTWSLADACDRVSCGVATGADSVFIMRDPLVPAVLRPFAYSTIAGRHLSCRNRVVREAGWSMLVPYRTDGRLLTEAELGPLGPYLREPSRRTRLLGRTCVARKPWYAFHENPPLRDILRPKLLCKDIGREPAFVADELGNLVPRHSVYYMVPRDPARLHDLAAYLNSAVAKSWLRDHCQRAANGFLRLQSSVLKSLPIPERFVATARPIAESTVPPPRSLGAT